MLRPRLWVLPCFAQESNFLKTIKNKQKGILFDIYNIWKCGDAKSMKLLKFLILKKINLY
jgi:hypothetical protein